MRPQKAGGNPLPPPLRRDGDRQDFRFVGGDAGQDKARQLFLPGGDRPIGEGLRRDKKLFEIGLLPGIGEACRVDRRAFGTPLGADRADVRRSFGRPSNHWQSRRRRLELRGFWQLGVGHLQIEGPRRRQGWIGQKPKLGNKNDVQPGVFDLDLGPGRRRLVCKQGRARSRKPHWTRAKRPHGLARRNDPGRRRGPSVRTKSREVNIAVPRIDRDGDEVQLLLKDQGRRKGREGRHADDRNLASDADRPRRRNSNAQAR